MRTEIFHLPNKDILQYFSITQVLLCLKYVAVTMLLSQGNFRGYSCINITESCMDADILLSQSVLASPVQA